MGAFQNACRATDDGAFADLAGVELQHDLHLSVRKWTDWSVIAERVAIAGGEVHALQLARAGDVFSVRCRLKRISADAARSLIDGLLDERLAERATVEHLVLSVAAAR